MVKKDWLIEQIQTLADALAENRSDIYEILYDVLAGKDVDVSRIESRFIYASIPIPENDILIEYDTLTTTISYNWNDGWKTAEDHEYIKN